jgi:MFS family permease
MIGLLVIGPLLDHVGRKFAIVFSTVLFGCFTLLTAAAHGVPDLFFYRLMAGIGLGGALFPASRQKPPSWFPRLSRWVASPRASP